MKSNYKRIGDFIQLVNQRNTDMKATELLGINIDKFFMPSVANVVGTDLSVYKIVQPGQFACNRMHVGRDKRIPIAFSDKSLPFMVSPAYEVFEITNKNILDPEYLMMWFSRNEFDRNTWFFTDADVRGGLSWDAFCSIELPVPSIEKQREIVKEYNTIVNRIKLNEQLNQKLEETAQAIYKQWFVDFESNELTPLSKYVETNPTLEIKKGKIAAYIEMRNLSESSMCISEKNYREYSGGSKFQNNDILLARITPCLENGKTAFVDILKDKEVAAGSTEFIVLRAKDNISPYWVYCLARDEQFRSYAISSMVGSSGRQRVHEKYLEDYLLPKIDYDKNHRFHKTSKPIFENIKLKSIEIQKLTNLKNLLLSKITKVETEKEVV